MWHDNRRHVCLCHCLCLCLCNCNCLCLCNCNCLCLCNCNCLCLYFWDAFCGETIAGMCVDVCVFVQNTVSFIGLFCKRDVYCYRSYYLSMSLDTKVSRCLDLCFFDYRSLLQKSPIKRLYSAKETCNFIDPTNCSHPMGYMWLHVSVYVFPIISVCVYVFGYKSEQMFG